MFISNHFWIFMVIIQMMFGGLLRLGAGKQTGSRALNNHKVKMPWAAFFWNCQCNAPGQYIDMGFLFIKTPFFSHPNHSGPLVVLFLPGWLGLGSLHRKTFQRPKNFHHGRMLLNFNDGLSHLFAFTWVQSNQSSAWRRYHLPPPGGDKATRCDKSLKESKSLGSWYFLGRQSKWLWAVVLLDGHGSKKKWVLRSDEVGHV